ncbi:uncharacterized protein LOC116919333, partial [Daphnia magna]|uniref:uncharacterized protein LOC116919333 n=1 Tax=Daphnia magna TaxID=35525 RepID=UPI001E1BD1A4
HFGGRVKSFIHPTISIGKIVFKSTLSMGEALSTKFDKDKKIPVQITNAAYILRNVIFKQSKKAFSTKITVNDVMEGEVQVPPLLKEFFECLVAGHINPAKIREGKQIRIKSLCEDSIFSVTNGRCRPSKHVVLSLVMKSVTGSRKVIEVFNKLGHGVAFDNYDRFVETLTGKDTLHDTVGIVYQDVSECIQENPDEDEVNPEDNKDNQATSFDGRRPSSRRRRAFCYLPQLNISPTSNSAMLETLKMSKRLAKECNQKYFSVTYDLAISKMALTIQAEEKPEYDCLFIHPGSFHIELFLFKAI